MGIKDYKHYTLSDPEAVQRAHANITAEYRRRVALDSEDAGARYLQTLSITASDADAQAARDERDRGQFREFRKTNPFEGAALGRDRPDLYRGAPETKRDEVRAAQARAIGGPAAPKGAA